MGKVVGEEIIPQIVRQIRARQKLHGAGTNKKRTDNQLKVLNSQNAWVKMASGVTLTGEKVAELGGKPQYKGTTLPKNYLLFNGTSTINKQRDGFKDGSYLRSEFGLVPMPGIKKFNVKNLNRGSLKKATIDIQVHSKRSFAIIDALYMRLGYTVLIEWGNNMYTSNGNDVKTMGKTLIENEFFKTDADYSTLLNQISIQRSQKNGNYDAMLGKVSNFEWKFNPDGSYDITLTVISIGDIIESLTVNLPPSEELINVQEFIEERGGEKVEGREKSQLHSMFWMWRYMNLGSSTGTSSNFIEGAKDSKIIPTYKDSTSYLGYTLSRGDENFGVWKYYRKWYYDGAYYDKNMVNKIDNFYCYDYYDKTFTQEQKDSGEMEQWKLDRRWSAMMAAGGRAGDPKADVEEWTKEHWKEVRITLKASNDYQEKAGVNPCKMFGPQDGFRTAHGLPFYYIRFGALLKYISEEMLPKYKRQGSDETTPVLNIDYSEDSSYMFLMPNQLSLDIKKCFIANQFIPPLDTPTDSGNWTKGLKQFDFNYDGSPLKSIQSESLKSPVFPTDADGKITSDKPSSYTKDPTSHPNKGLTMNIYLNFDYVLEVLNNNIDEDNNISVYNFIDSLCKGLNKTLGEVNNLEASIDEDTNTLRIIDTTPIPGEVISPPENPYELSLLGYRKGESGFLRKIDIKTSITPEFATMVTVGATSGGYTKGVEATAFSKWNKGIIDRFKEEIEPSSNSSKDIWKEREPLSNYTKKYITGGYGSLVCSDWDGGGKWRMQGYKSEVADSNQSIVPEFYKYALYRKSLEENGGTSSTVGFIPFKMSLTMDGLSGIKIYNVLRIDSSFLPDSYGKTLDFIVTGIDHSVSNNDWETNLTLTVMPKSDKVSGKIENYDYLFSAFSAVRGLTRGGLDNILDRVSPSSRTSSGRSGGGGTGDGKGTLGTGATDEFAKKAYTSKTKLEAAIKRGLDIINNI